MSIQNQKENMRYTIVLCTHLEIPLVKLNNRNRNLDRVIHFFQEKMKDARPKTLLSRDYQLIIDTLKTAQSTNACRFETFYQNIYKLFIVLSFDNFNSAKQFESSISDKLIFRHALTIDLPMQYSVNFPAESIGSTKTNFEISKQFTLNESIREELTDAKDLLNFASSEFQGVKIECMYQENLRLCIILSFETITDRNDFLVKYNQENEVS